MSIGVKRNYDDGFRRGKEKKMKHGIFYAYWEQEWEADYIYYVEKAAKLGFDILEIGAKPLPDYTESEVEALRKAADEHGITLTCGYGPSPDRNIGSADPAVKENGLKWYESLFAVMQKLDIQFLGGAIYAYWPVDYSQEVDKARDWANSVQGMKELAQIAKRYGVVLGMEVLNRFEGYLLNTAEEAVAFVKEIGMDNVKIHLDTFHMSIEEESIGRAIRTAGKYLGHLHTGERNRMVPGKGCVPWKEIGEALAEIGYDGNVVMEPFVRMGGTVGSDIKIWHDRSKGADEAQLDTDAKNALEFQRYMLG